MKINKAEKEAADGKINQIQGAVEAVLFAAGGAVSLEVLAQAVGHDKKSVKAITARLTDQYEKNNSGIRIIELDGSYQMCTNPDYYGYVQALLKNPPKKTLTQPLIETLAIVAYKQPITKGQIEEIRGVSADHAVNRLMELGLVTEKGRMDTAGKPILFGTTDEFLRHFGFSGLHAMPPLPQDTEDLKKEAENEVHDLLS